MGPSVRLAGEIVGNDGAANQIAGTEGDDILTGTDGADIIQGLAGSDLIDPLAGPDQVFGGAGNDIFRLSTLTTGYPQSRFEGGSGLDTFDFSVAASFLYFYTVSGEPNVFYVLDNRVSEVERIVGGSAGDILAFAYFTDALEVFGGPGDDSFWGGTGSDRFFGQAGADRANVDPGDFVDGGEGSDEFFVNGAFGTPPVAGAVHGGSGDDLMKLNIAFAVDLAAGTAKSGTATYAVSSIETVLVAAHYGYLTTVLGSDAEETLSINPLFNDGSVGVVFDGRGGNDKVLGSIGADDLAGGAGDDAVEGNAGNDVLRLNDGGNDTVLAGAGMDNIFFGAALTSADLVNGGTGVDTLVVQGPYGSLTLTASITQMENVSILGGNNINFGEPGTNRYDYVLTTNDSNFAADVQARINGAALLEGEDFTFDGSGETDASYVVYGGKGRDTLLGGLGNDIFFYAEERFAVRRYSERRSGL